MFIFYYKYTFLIKIKIICLFLKSKKKIIQILSYTKIYNSSYSYRYNANKVVNDDKSKFKNSSISSMLKVLSIHVKI